MTALQRFIAASAMTNLADGVAVVAWAWVASLLTRDALLVALVPVALRLPWFLLALPAGVITDRVDRRWLILRMDALRGVAFAGAALAIWAALPLAPAPAEGVSAPWLYASLVLAAFVVGGAEVFRDNAAQTMLPAFVPPDRLERANGQLWSAELLTNALIGPALGAVLIAAWLPLAFGVNAVAYGLALLLVAGVAGQFRPERTDPRNWRVELGEGLGFLRGKPLLRTLAWTTGFWNLFHQMIVIGVVLHAQENLGLSATAYGLDPRRRGLGRHRGQPDGRADFAGAGAGADDAVDGTGIWPLLCRDGAGAECGDAGPVLCRDGVFGICLECRVGQHAAAHDPGCPARSGQQPLPAAGLGDDAAGAAVVGCHGHFGRGDAAARSGADLAVLGGRAGVNPAVLGGLEGNSTRFCAASGLISTDCD